VPLFLGFLGVLAFSFTLPATRIAVEELDPPSSASGARRWRRSRPA
jgi:hypothetical protein